MAEKANLRIGIEDFGRIRRDGFYSVDKTGLSKDFLEHIAYVDLLYRSVPYGCYCLLSNRMQQKSNQAQADLTGSGLILPTAFLIS